MQFYILNILEANKCYGGIARLATAIKQVRKEDDNVILLNAGDVFQGTVWYSKFKWRPIAKFTNALNFTAAVILSNLNAQDN